MTGLADRSWMCRRQESQDKAILRQGCCLLSMQLAIYGQKELQSKVGQSRPPRDKSLLIFPITHSLYLKFSTKFTTSAGSCRLRSPEVIEGKAILIDFVITRVND